MNGQNTASLIGTRERLLSSPRCYHVFPLSVLLGSTQAKANETQVRRQQGADPTHLTMIRLLFVIFVTTLVVPTLVDSFYISWYPDEPGTLSRKYGGDTVAPPLGVLWGIIGGHFFVRKCERRRLSPDDDVPLLSIPIIFPAF
ncbi:hypothetical protein LSH36_1083g00002 [Paralvinella palmiformis]|uniref:Uncharacterized protein n=1 Tax=Paralvinella palmiformis TaxID=53620 RepID=A0AAD9MQC8_9ANNE|nr:hypothetical protein LSH36_1083g00002 [Paralvinella palmiformis]